MTSFVRQTVEVWFLTRVPTQAFPSVASEAVAARAELDVDVGQLDLRTVRIYESRVHRLRPAWTTNATDFLHRFASGDAESHLSWKCKTIDAVTCNSKRCGSHQSYSIVLPRTPSCFGIGRTAA